MKEGFLIINQSVYSTPAWFYSDLKIFGIPQCYLKMLKEFYEAHGL